MPTIETIANLSKKRGFIFPSSEIYGGFASTWDYGPLGVELKNNVKRAWWKSVVQERDDMVGLDGSILMHPQIWVASGHVENFNDPLVDCRKCKGRFRADAMESLSCPEGGEHDLTEPRQFNMMFRSHYGPVASDDNIVYFRPETAQAIFVNFDNVLTTSRKKLPFGIAQIGKAFRNEITPGNFIFRTREFEQMEIEYFVRPGTDEEWHERWLNAREQWFFDLGLRRENLRRYEHPQAKLSHYSKRTVDLLYRFFPERTDEDRQFDELEGIANRTDFDLAQHAAATGKDLTWFDPETNEHVKPYVIEPSVGVDRSVLAFLLDAYVEEPVRDKKRTVLKLHRDLAPIKVAVLPLLKNRPEIVELAKRIAADLRKRFVTVYDDTAGIGRLYRRQDEIGTLFCVTVDVQCADPGDEKYDGCVTIRARDSMEQTRVKSDGLVAFLRERLED